MFFIPVSDEELERASCGWEFVVPGKEPDYDELFEPLRREVDNWCEARPDAAILRLAAAYDELRHLDVKESNARRDMVHNIRLVCRLFCSLATPLMFPILRVQLSQSSLDFADKISRTPQMAAGVRGIQVSLGYRPKEIADDMAQFKQVRLNDLNDLEERYLLEPRGRGYEEIEGDEAVKRTKALGNMSRLTNE